MSTVQIVEFKNFYARLKFAHLRHHVLIQTTKYSIISFPVKADPLNSFTANFSLPIKNGTRWNKAVLKSPSMSRHIYQQLTIQVCVTNKCMPHQSTYNIFRLIHNLTYRRIFTGKVWTDGSRLLQELNLDARQPRRAPHHIIQATTCEGLAQGPSMAARVGFKLATFHTEGT